MQETTAELAEISNLRGRIERLKLEGEELAKYGPAKHPDKQGLDQYSEDFGNGPVEKGAFYCADPTGRRTGDACDPNVAKVLTKTLEEAAAMIHKSQVQAKVYMTRKALEDKIDEIRGAIMICYPAGLPEWDLMRHCVEGTEDLGAHSGARTCWSRRTPHCGSRGSRCCPRTNSRTTWAATNARKSWARFRRKGRRRQHVRPL